MTAAVARPILGKIACRTCSGPAVLREATSGLAYYTCQECGSQHFARGLKADTLLRSYLLPTPKAANDAAVKPATAAKDSKPDAKPKTPPAAPAGKPAAEPVTAAGGRARGIF